MNALELVKELQAQRAENQSLRHELAQALDSLEQAQAPKTVATLERDFEQTIAYFRLEGLPRELIRSTSLLERTNRELRRKFRQACCFGSLKGARVAIYLQVQRLNAHWADQPWSEVSHALYLDFLALNP